MIQDRIAREIAERRRKIQLIVGEPDTIMSWIDLEKQISMCELFLVWLEEEQ